MEYSQKEEGMRKAYLALLTGFIMTGCTPMENPHAAANAQPKTVTSQTVQEVKYMVSPAGEGPTAPSTQAFSIYNAINRGVMEDKAADLLAPVTLETGKIYLKNNTRRTYYKVGKNTQFWIEIKGDMNPVIIAKGPLEAKQEWKRYADDVIEIVEEPIEK